MPEPSGPIAARLIGTWRLKSYFEVTPGCAVFHPFGPHPEGLLMYTAEGYVSAQLMAPGRPVLSGVGLTRATPGEFTAAGAGFIGYSGTYVVDEARAVVTHFPVVAFAPNMVGSPQERALELRGDVLVLVARHPKVGNLPQTESHLEWIRVTAGQQQEAE